MILKTSVFLLLTLPVLVWAQKPVVGGQLWHSQFSSLSKPLGSSPVLSRSTLSVDAGWSATDELLVKAEPWIYWVYASETANQTFGSMQSELRRGFLEYTKNGADLKLGREVVSWGSSDAINPTDYLGVKDQTFLTFEEDHKRRALNILSLGFTPNQGASAWNYIFVWSAEAPRTKLLFSETSVSGIQDLGVRGSQAGDLGDNFAGKIQYLGDGWDLSVSGYSGQNPIPELQLLDSTLTALKVARQHQRMWAAGLDGSYSEGKWIFRIESAYKSYRLFAGRGELLQSPMIESVLGVERPMGDRIRVHAQLVTKIATDWKDPSKITGANAIDTTVLQGIQKINHRLQGTEQGTELGGTARITYTNEDENWEWQLFTLYLSKAEASLFRPSVKYKAIPNLRLVAGVESYTGPLDTGLGSLRDLSSIFFEAGYSF